MKKLLLIIIIISFYFTNSFADGHKTKFKDIDVNRIIGKSKIREFYDEPDDGKDGNYKTESLLPTREDDIGTAFKVEMNPGNKPILVLKRGCNIKHKLDNNIDPIQKTLIYTAALRELLKTYLTDNKFEDCPWKSKWFEEINKKWGRQFAIKGIMSVDDAKKAIDVGATAIMISNHGGRQLDGSRSPFDQLAEIVDAVGDKIDVICEGGIRRGTHVLKALSLGAKACSGGRMYLYALASGGQKGVERSLTNLRNEIERDMKLMGVSNIKELTRKNLRFR